MATRLNWNNVLKRLEHLLMRVELVSDMVINYLITLFRGALLLLIGGVTPLGLVATYLFSAEPLIKAYEFIAILCMYVFATALCMYAIAAIVTAIIKVMIVLTEDCIKVVLRFENCLSLKR